MVGNEMEFPHASDFFQFRAPNSGEIFGPSQANFVANSAKFLTTHKNVGLNFPAPNLVESLKGIVQKSLAKLVITCGLFRRFFVIGGREQGSVLLLSRRV